MPVFVHSFGDPKPSPKVYLHSQAIIDVKTIVAIIRAVLEGIEKRRCSPA